MASEAPEKVPEAEVVDHTGLTLDQKYAIARSVGEECIQESELRFLLSKKPQPICYDGFEPSGRMHIAQGVLKAINVNKLTSVGCKFIFWVADWFALLNNKMGGDLAKIQKVGRYMVEVWKAAGMDMNNVEFVWTSEEINRKPDEYWNIVMDIARRFNIKRVIRCATIMGREEKGDMPAAQILYPCMQCADIFFLKADICQLGMDQRKVNMLAREYCDFPDVKKKRKFKPIILSHHMLMGLKEGQVKMSKSDPESAIFMEDEATDVIRKISNAFCPEGVVAKNPCVDYVKHIVFGKFDQFVVAREAERGGDKTYTNVEEFVADYESGAVSSQELKAALAAAINVILEPVRDHFRNNEEARSLLQEVRSFQVTR
eukprot:TRINITY_DN13750_c0_g1_i1.p1 TRINITY_DN13750_c0_g1~~TRINITY_DN13750_c0_g1_i1.p1  ORF type:complete len:373 (+),score=138.15 TRINITY_DN13750_c0_g1_i1:55-1173(+)